MVVDEKMRRHLGAVLRKNFILKRRSPCSLLCELLLAIGATGLMVLTRALVSSTKAVQQVPSQLLTEKAALTRLPECAEYVLECHAELLQEYVHSPLCVKGITYGCEEGSSRGDGAPGIWVSMGCNGTFTLGPDTLPVRCHSGERLQLRRCYTMWRQGAHATLVGGRRLQERSRQRGPPLGGAASKLKNMDASTVSALMRGSGQSGLRRLSANFGIAPADGGGRLFHRWLQQHGHPWAASVRLFESEDALQAHLTSPDYPEQDMKQNRSTKLCGAVVFKTPPESEKVRYVLRFNTTLGVDPGMPPLAGLMGATRIKTDELTDSKGHQGKSQGGAGAGGSSWYATGLMALLEGFLRNSMREEESKFVSSNHGGPGGGAYQGAGIAWYTQSGFLAMQRTVDTFLRDLAEGGADFHDSTHEVAAAAAAAAARHGRDGGSRLLGEDSRPHFVVPFPVAGREKDVFAMMMPHLLAPFLLISLTFSVNRMITSVVHEREARLRDGMRLMGMEPAAFYLSWILTYVAIYLFVCVGVTGCLSLGRILPNSSPSLLFVWLLLFSLASISYALLITAFFTRAKTAATVGSVAFYASSYLQHLVNASTSPTVVRLLSLLPPVSFELTAKSIANLESQGVGMVWTNWGHPWRNFSVRSGCEMLTLDAIVLLVAFLYLDQVLPREMGWQRPWYFPLLPSFWCGRRRAVGAVVPSEPSLDEDTAVELTSAIVERDVGEAAAALARSGQCVELRGLSKVFGDVRAVKELDLVMYQGEIFALLGHNGAGKTTTFAMLCGLVTPTSGSCTVFGLDLCKDLAQVQKSLGVCPQHDVLWSSLTCEEHLTLFAGFKGVPRASVSQEVSSILQRVGLGHAGAIQAGRLSGGMKRKLSLGIAFVGSSRLVVLDEPTSGLDPYSRRSVWELLRAMKQGRISVLSTHYMDEADILGDRIAILHEGSLRCCGTPQFLKRAYDCGYNVAIVKRTGCQTDAVREALIRHMPELASEVRTLTDTANELILQFPFAAASMFPRVLGGLEEQLVPLAVESYGVSVTTLEEVFLKVASGERVERSKSSTANASEVAAVVQAAAGVPAPAPLPGAQAGGGGASRAGEYVEMLEWNGEAQPLADPEAGPASRSASTGRCQRCPKLRRFVAHSKALFLKRIRCGLRDCRGLLCQLFLPLGTLVLLLAIISQAFFHSMPLLKLDAKDFNAHCEVAPQNTVDYTHLASVGTQEATSLVEAGCPFWHGVARRLPPKPEDQHGRDVEESVTNGLPHLAQLLRMTVSDIVVQDPELRAALRQAAGHRRRLLEESMGSEGWHQPMSKQGGDSSATNHAGDVQDDRYAIRRVEAHFWQWVGDLWSAKERLEQELGSWPGGSDDTAASAGAMTERRRLDEDTLQSSFAQQLPTTKKSAFDRAEELPKSAGQWLQDQLPPGWQKSLEEGQQNLSKAVLKGLASLGGLQRLGRFSIGSTDPNRYNGKPTWAICAKLSRIEQMLWLVADTDRDGYLTRDELDMTLQHYLSTPARRSQRWGADAEATEQAVLDETLTNVVFGLLDEDRDGKISQREYCELGADVKEIVGHYMGLAAHFSGQLLNSSAPCPRYGAYFVLHGPRRGQIVPLDAAMAAEEEDDDELQVGSHAALFVNTTSLHSAPVFQAALTNAIFSRQGLKKQVEVDIHPFPQSHSEQQNLEKIAVFFLAIYTTFSLSFIPSGIAHFVVKERQSGAQQLQLLSGVSHFSYWLTNLIFDLGLYAVPAACIPAALEQFGFSMILRGNCGTAVTVVLIAFGPAMAGFTYIVSFLFKDASKAANVILSFCLVGATVLSTVLFILDVININPVAGHPMACDTPTKDSPEGDCAFPTARKFDRVLGPLFRLVPTVCLYQALFTIAFVSNMHAVSEEALKAIAAELDTQISFSPFAYEWAGEPLCYLCAEAVGYFVIAVFVDWCMHNPRVHRLLDADACTRRFSPWRRTLRNRYAAARSSPMMESTTTLVETGEGEEGEGAGDGSVEMEKNRVAFLSPRDVALHVEGLEKVYRHWLAPHMAPKRAVRGVSFAVHAGEVFGLLGHNGAGKTSALKCLVGELGCTAGTIHVGGYDLDRQGGLARRCIGYCPQFDALLELLTVRDHLEFYAGLKELPPKAAEQAMRDFGLEKMAKRRGDVLSGGNKRKLSAAIALMGRPSLAVLDEPSCGLDPAARRALWSAVHRAVNGAGGGSAVLLTTHSMEEAEALSTRLGILAEGNLLTVGTSQQIKQRHGSSHELCLALAPETEGALVVAVQQMGGGTMAMDTRLDYSAVSTLLDGDPNKHRAYTRPRCVVRAQIEGTGYVEASVVAEWWRQQARGEAIETFLRDLVGDGVELAENFGATWRFRLPKSSSVGLPQLFKHLEDHGKRLGIAEYTLSQATLEQIFNNMAQEAEEERAATTTTAGAGGMRFRSMARCFFSIWYVVLIRVPYRTARAWLGSSTTR